jgi:ATP-dependent DNA helicase RecQ
VHICFDMAEGEPSRGARVDFNEVRTQAKLHFGVRRFRPGQRELISAALAGRNALGVLPTGSGKSLCYQLPSLFLKGVVVVVSPLIALMQDQHEKLLEADVDAARLDSTIKRSEQRDVEEELEDGAHHIVLVTPERLASEEHLEPLRNRGVDLFVVDEAHCVSQWGHDFRPAYLGLRHAIEALGRPTVQALTATATPEVARDILEVLGIPDAEIIQTGIERENLTLQVMRTVNREEKERRLLALLAETEGSAIVYVATVRRVNELYDWLHAQGVDVERYHGKLCAAEREQAQHRFMHGEARVMVATSAFGLGIDKPDIRLVAHWNFPESVETYYQEAGRAGRDGLPARAVLLYQLEDKRIRSFFLGGKHPKRHEALALLEALAHAQVERRSTVLSALAEQSGLSLKRAMVIASVLETMEAIDRCRQGIVPRRRLMGDELQRFLDTFEAQYQADRERLQSMMAYGQSALCRMQFLREYFGEPQGERCERCDNCTAPLAATLPVPKPVPAIAPAPDAESAPKPAARFQPGETVRHARFGTGEVVAVDNQTVTVRFVRGGERRVKDAYLRAQAAGSSRRQTEQHA